MIKVALNMKYIFALGNPGRQYEKNYHNLGIICAQWLAKKLPHEKSVKKGKHEIWEFEKFKLIKSLSFMNLSFESMMPIYFGQKLKPQDFLVMHDELMLNKYDIKLKTPTNNAPLGNAGHNGLKNIAQHIGSNFSRLRIGIDHPKNFTETLSVSDYVLSNIDNLEKYHQAFEDKAMHLINTWLESFI